MYKREIFEILKNRIKEPRKFIQVFLGPRQVGKTTLSIQLLKEIAIPHHYINADTATLKGLTCIEAQWEIARHKAKSQNECILIIDEVQKIPNWSELIKELWDEDTRLNVPLKNCNIRIITLVNATGTIRKPYRKV